MELFFSPGVDASHVYVRAWALGCLHSLINTQTPSTGLRHPSVEEGAGKRCSEWDKYLNLSEGADRVGGQLHGDKECPISDVTKSGRVWRKVPENGARSVWLCLISQGSCTYQALCGQHL